MRFKPQHRRDGNSQEIIHALREHGALVLDLSQVGKGCGDCLVFFRSKLYLLEIKQNKKSQLTEAEAEFHKRWQDAVTVVTTSEEALIAVGVSWKRIK